MDDNRQGSQLRSKILLIIFSTFLAGVMGATWAHFRTQTSLLMPEHDLWLEIGSNQIERAGNTKLLQNTYATWKEYMTIQALQDLHYRLEFYSLLEPVSLIKDRVRKVAGQNKEDLAMQALREASRDALSAELEKSTLLEELRGMQDMERDAALRFLSLVEWTLDGEKSVEEHLEQLRNDVRGSQ